jgi:cell wall-associated NlpC family hydrolase
VSPLKPRIQGRLAAAAIPIGVAAVFAFQATASAAPSASAQPVTHASVTAVRSASRHKAPEAARLRAYAWALRQKGHPYVWGGTGPGFDCSGLVMMAYRHVGIHLPRTTTEMLRSHLLVWVKIPKMGDLAFYGSGHVELFRKWGCTFGAHDFGSPVGLIHYGWGWKPTAYYRVRVSAHKKHRK